MGRWARSHAAASSKPGSSRPLMRSRNVVQRSTWRSWKPSGRPRSARPLACQSTLPKQRDAFDQLEGQAAPLLEVGVEGRGPLAPGRHGGPAVHEAHDVEGPAQHRLVGADGDGLGVGHVRPRQRLDDAPLAENAVIAATPARSAAGCAWPRGGRPDAVRRSRSGCRPICIGARAAPRRPGPANRATPSASRRRRSPGRRRADSSVMLTGSLPPTPCTARTWPRPLPAA